MPRLSRFCILLVAVLVCTGRAFADEAAARKLLAQAILATGDDQLKLVGQLADQPYPIVAKVLNAWPQDGVYVVDDPAGGSAKIPVMLEDAQDADGKQLADRIDTGELLKDASGKPVSLLASDLTTADDTDYRLLGAIKDTMEQMTLADPDVEARRAAVMKLGMTQQVRFLAVLQARVPKETNPVVQKALTEAIAVIELKDPKPDVQEAAVKKLAALNDLGAEDALKRVAEDPKSAPEVAKSAQVAVKQIDSYLSYVNFFGTVFRGMSEGSILLVVAIGLAITFGLMGVINMAHGELIAVGAYTCYIIENVFAGGLWLSPFGVPVHLPGLNLSGATYQSYFLFAIPAAFLSAAIVGVILERCVIRFLYRRPLESLLATWGVSLILQQSFRLVFGAANVQVNSPSWLSGNFTISDVVLGYNRIFVIGFAILIVICTWLLLTRTPLGLLIRAVMQNRNMAACMGVRTETVNMLTFGFGSGLAGLAGAFLSQIGNVGPSLGQSYIVDSFMTVVIGGVGNIAGTVYSALGIGTADQILQQVFGSPVVGKITVLVCIILFLQWKPSGLFATRGRGLES